MKAYGGRYVCDSKPVGVADIPLGVIQEVLGSTLGCDTGYPH